MKNRSSAAAELAKNWKSDPRWRAIVRPYSAEDVVRLRGTLHVQYTIADRGAKKFWKLLEKENFVPALGAMTGLQAVQMVQAGLTAIYCSGWQVAADANLAGETYPDQSLYPEDSVPSLVRRINNAFQRADQIHHAEGKNDIDWFAPIVADAEAGFGGILNTFELMKLMAEAGAACVHLEDQLASVKKCGHMGGKVVVPTSEFIQKLVAARLATDILGIPTLIMARTDSKSATLLTNDVDPNDKPFLTGERSAEGFYRVKSGMDAVIARSLAYAPYADLLWFETSDPNLDDAKKFAEAIHKKFPGKYLAYNCSPSFNWERKLLPPKIASFQKDLAKLGYKFQFVTLAGFHSINLSIYQLAKNYKAKGMTAYAELQHNEFLEKENGYEATEHQRFVGTGYFDEIAQVISGGTSSTLAIQGSTEEEQFKK